VTLSEIFNNTKHRAVSLRQLSYLFAFGSVKKLGVWDPLKNGYFGVSTFDMDYRTPLPF